jgi:hypothetical protein
VKDKGTGAENLIWLAGRQSGRPNSSLPAADDILAALTGRIAELEARVSAILAEVGPELPPVDSKLGTALSAPKPDAGRGADNVRGGRVEADAELTRASEERRMLANEMRLLREAFQEARRSQPPAAPVASSAEAQIAPDLRAAIADEMRSLLTELLADFRSRALDPSVMADTAKSETTVPMVEAAHAPMVEEAVEALQAPSIAFSVADAVVTEPAGIVEHVDEPVSQKVEALVDENLAHIETAPRSVDELAIQPTPVEASASIVEDVDELVRQAPKLLVPADDSPVNSAPAQPAASMVEEYEEFLQTDSPPSVETVDHRMPMSELAPPTVDEHVFGPAEAVSPTSDELVEMFGRLDAPPPTETFDVGAAVASPIEPIVEHYVGEVRESEALTSAEAVELSAALPEPVVDERIEAVRLPEPPPVETFDLGAPPAEPFVPIVEEYHAEPVRNDLMDRVADPVFPVIPPIPPAPVPDPRLAALWDAAALPMETEPAPLAPPEPASFITEDFIAETRPLEIPEEGYPPQELAPEQTIDYVPPPSAEFAPPPVEFAPEPPTIVEPESHTWTGPLVTEPERVQSFSSLFPELTVADERGLHQIQVVISPIHSFPRLLETERRIRALSTVNALHLRDFRNGVATLTVSVGEAISPAEFGAVIQMLEDLHLRLEGTSLSSVELRAEDDSPTE